MKKSMIIMNMVIATTLAAPVSSYAADNRGFIRLQATVRDYVQDDSTKPNRYGVKVAIGHALDENKNFIGDIDVQTQATSKDGAGSVFSRVEGGLTITNGSIFVRTALGERLNATDNWTYYSIEPGYKYKFNDKFAASIAWRWRSALDDKFADDSKTWKFGTEYSLDKSNSLTAMYGISRGDSDWNGLNLGFVHRF